MVSIHTPPAQHFQPPAGSEGPAAANWYHHAAAKELKKGGCVLHGRTAVAQHTVEPQVNNKSATPLSRSTVTYSATRVEIFKIFKIYKI